MTVNDFIKTIRLKKAAKLLSAGEAQAEVSTIAVYADQKYFSRECKKHSVLLRENGLTNINRRVHLLSAKEEASKSSI